jgi:uncharacterized protein YkwD
MKILNARLARSAPALFAFLISILLVACGGGGGGDSAPAAAEGSPAASAQALGNTDTALAGMATEGLNWFNVRRQQIGLTPVTRNTLLDSTAQGHSNYQKLNNTITHDQVPGKPGFTGEHLKERLAAAGYTFTENNFSYGEVIAATTDGSGTQAAEDLIGAIYHRFVIFEPMFREAGAGAAQVSGGYTFFTTNFAANGLGAGIGRGNFVTYPSPNQQDVDRSVFSDRETPDPVAGQDEAGYPISVHADIVAAITVQSFSVSARGGAALPVRLHTSANDPETPPSAAAIIPTAPLAAKTIYDVQFTGVVEGVPASRAWSFTTR